MYLYIQKRGAKRGTQKKKRDKYVYILHLGRFSDSLRVYRGYSMNQLFIIEVLTFSINY